MTGKEKGTSVLSNTLEKNLIAKPETEFLWFCHLAHDGEFLGTKDLPPRRPTLEYLSSLIETSAEMGFSSLLTAVNYHMYHETWTVAMALLARTRGAGLLIATRPGIYHPAQFAKMAATAQNLFPGRVRINMVMGSSSAERAMYGDFGDKDSQLARTRDYLTLVRKLWEETPVTYKSNYLEVEGAVLDPKPVLPIPIYLGGASEEAQRIAVDLADVYLTWADKREVIAERVQNVKALARAKGKTIRVGLRLHVLVRETEAEAWAAAERMISRVDPEVRKAFLASHSSVHSTGQRRQIELAASGDLVIEPNLWAGIGLARTGVGLAIVGNPEQVAAKLRDYESLEIDTFILSGYPHLDEARRFGELVMPLFGKDTSSLRTIATDTVAPLA
jgi:alkanesulfonate monooxygenase